jgi:hypothetical protein
MIKFAVYDHAVDNPDKGLDPEVRTMPNVPGAPK